MNNINVRKKAKEIGEKKEETRTKEIMKEIKM